MKNITTKNHNSSIKPLTRTTARWRARALAVGAGVTLFTFAVSAADALRFVIPQAWSVGSSNSTYQEWDRFTSTANNLPDLGWLANPSATSTSKLSALPPGALSGTGSFYAFAGDYGFQAVIYNNSNSVPANWGTHVIVQTAATLGSGDAVIGNTLSLVDTNGVVLAGGAATNALRYDALFAGTVSSPAGPVTTREELWEFFLPGYAGDFRLQATMKQHSSLRQVRVDTLRVAQTQPLLRIPILHPETNFGEFSANGNAPTSLGTFDAGLHLITAKFGDDGSNNDDADIFSFTVPAGYELTGLNVLSYVTTNGAGSTGSFFAIADGAIIGTTIPTATNHLSNALIAQPGPLLDNLAASAYFGTSRIAPGQPLSAGTYTLFLNEITAQVDIALAITVSRAPLQFQLLTWNDANATAELPSAVGRKPSAPMPTLGDWLVFTADDAPLAAANNPLGAVSHNFVDITGAGGPGYNLAPSLSGTLQLRLDAVSGSQWAATLTALSYSGQANAAQAMNQFLVTSGSQAATNSAFNIDGAGNSGQWTANASNNWAIQYAADFYLATSADGDPSPTDIDATFNEKPQTGFLIPVNQLTTNGLAAVTLDDPLGFHTGDFKTYLLEQIKPRLPAHATYLLITQMGKTHPGYAELGLPITTNSLVGNTTIAYSTNALAVAPTVVSLQVSTNGSALRFNGSVGQAYAIQRSANLTDWETVTNAAFTYPAAGVVQWTDATAAGDRRFYRVLVVTP